MKKVLGIIIAVLLMGLCACKNNCYVPTYGNMGIAFVDSATLAPVSVKGLTIKGVGNDSVLYNNATASTAYVPLKQNATETQFEMSFLRGATDSIASEYVLTVGSQPYPQLIGPECGCVMFYSIQSVTCHGATDTLHVEMYHTDVINEAKDIHVKIYL